MQTVILCGGKGTRIRDVSDDLPKPMIPIGGRPILWHIMKLYAHHGHRDFILCLGHKGWQIKRFFLDYFVANADLVLDLRSPQSYEVLKADGIEDWRVTLAETGLETMTGGRIKRIEQYITGDDFLLTYGDGLADIDVAKILDFHRSHGRIATVTAVTPPSRFGELDLEGQKIVSFMEKPALVSGHVSGGFFVLNRRVFEFLDDRPDLVFELDVLPHLASIGELMAYRHEGFWHAMDSGRDHQALNELWDTGRAPWSMWAAPKFRVAA